jgi:DNA-binding transcriptional LysR family regulator
MLDREGALSLFVRVVDAGSFSEAARHLGLTPSAVSKQIARLEDRLGARLVERTTRRLGVTEVGRQLHHRARRILADIDEAERAVSESLAQARGTLRVTASLAFGQRWLAPHAAAFLAEHEQVRLELLLTDQLVDLVAEGIDVAIRFGHLADSALVARRLAPHRRIICASPVYVARAGQPLRPADLARHNCLTFSGRPDLNHWPFRVGGKSESVAVAGRLSASSGEALHAAALNGAGIARIASFLALPDLKAGRLVALLEEFAPPDSEAVFAVYPSSRHMSPKLRAFIDFLLRRLKLEPTVDG